MDEEILEAEGPFKVSFSSWVKQGRRSARAEKEKTNQKNGWQGENKAAFRQNPAKEKHKNKKIIKRMKKKDMKKGKGQYYIVALLRQKRPPKAHRKIPYQQWGT